MNIRPYQNICFKGLLQIGFIVTLFGVLLSCVPSETQDSGSLVSSRTPQPRVGGEIKVTTTPNTLVSTTQSIDANLLLTFTPIPNPTTNVNITTATLSATSTPNDESISFDFSGKVVVSVAANKDTNESTLWLLSPPEFEPELLLQEKGIGLTQPLVSPTGRYMAYIRYEEDTASIWVMDMVTKETNQWSSNFSIKHVDRQGRREAWNGITLQSWSPNEQALIFQEWERDVLLDEPIWSYVLFANGDSKQLGSRIHDISWSPINPDELVFISGLEGVYQSNTTRIIRPSLVLTTPELYAGSISWHPDGKHLAVAAGLPNETPLWVIDLDTREVVKLAEGVPGSQLVRWSPNGDFLFWKLQDSSKLLQFSNDFFDLFTAQMFPALNPYSDPTNEKIWLPDSNHLGFLQGLFVSPNEVDLCFYSTSGEKMDCPASSEVIFNQLDLDESIARITFSWVP